MLAHEFVAKLQEFGLDNYVRLNFYVVNSETGEKYYMGDDIMIGQHSPGCAIVVTLDVAGKSDEENFKYA